MPDLGPSTMVIPSIDVEDRILVDDKVLPVIRIIPSVAFVALDVFELDKRHLAVLVIF